MNRYKKICIILITVCCYGCATESETELTPEKAPIVIGIAYDISISAKALPVMDAAFIETIARFVASRSGVLAIGLIAEDSFQRLHRYALTLETVPVTGLLHDRARKQQMNIKRQKQFLIQVEKIKQEIGQKIKIRDRRVTDIDGSLTRFDLLFSERNFDNHEKLLIIVSDGVDTRTKSIKHIPAAEIWLVGWPPDEATQTFQNTPKQLFESLEGITNNLQNRFSERGHYDAVK